MSDTAVYEKLTQIFHEVFGRDDITLSPQMTARDIAEWDSLAHIRLIFAVEEGFNIRISSTETQLLENVGAFANLIRSKTEKAA